MKKILLLLALAVPAMASGPKHQFKDPLLNDEFDNSYHDIEGVLRGHFNMVYNGTTLLKIMQVVSGTSVTNFSTTSNTFQTTNLSASITPTSVSSKILVLVSGNLRIGAAGVAAYATIARGGTNILASNGMCKTKAASATGVLDAACSMVYLDSPASVAALTYAVQIKNSDNATGAEWPSETTTFTQAITLVEIL